MARYHINGKGEPGQCRAQHSCPFGGAEDHHDSPEAAREAFEAQQAGSFSKPAPDPRKETELIIEPVKAERIRPGDIYDNEEVLTATTGRKWVTLKTDKRSEVLVAKDEQVVVLREHSTERAREAAEAMQQERQIKSKIEEAPKRVKAAAERIKTAVDEHGYADYGPVTQLIESQEEAKIWESVAYIADNRGISYKEAVELKVEQIRKATARYGLRSGLSRSTSVIANAVEDAKTEAYFSFLREHEDGWF